MRNNFLFGKAAVVAALSSIFAGAVSSNEFPDSLPSLDKITSAKLALYPLNINTYAPVTEKDILRDGCVFDLEKGTSELTELHQILNSGIKFGEESSGAFQLRNVIYLNLNDGTTVRFMISDAHNTKPGAIGFMDTGGSSSVTYLSSDEKTLKMLRSWARGNVRIKNTSDFC